MAGAFELFQRPEAAEIRGSAFETVTPAQQLQNWHQLNAREDAWRAAEGSPWKAAEPGWFGRLMQHPGTQGILNAVNFIGPGPKMPARTMAPAGKGGGDLPMDLASRLARAKEMGFDTDQTFYHGTDRPFTSFNSSFNENYPFAAFFADSPRSASEYAMSKAQFGNGAPSVMPVYVRPGRQKVHDAKGARFDEIDIDELAVRAAKAGHDSLYVRNVIDPGGEMERLGGTMVVFNPKNIRSTNAAFDPAQSNSSNIMASHAAPAIGAAGAGALGAFTRRDEEAF